jgi:hypothetical protein
MGATLFFFELLSIHMDTHTQDTLYFSLCYILYYSFLVDANKKKLCVFSMDIVYFLW